MRTFLIAAIGFAVPIAADAQRVCVGGSCGPGGGFGISASLGQGPGLQVGFPPMQPPSYPSMAYAQPTQPPSYPSMAYAQPADVWSQPVFIATPAAVVPSGVAGPTPARRTVFAGLRTSTRASTYTDGLESINKLRIGLGLSALRPDTDCERSADDNNREQVRRGMGHHVQRAAQCVADGAETVDEAIGAWLMKADSRELVLGRSLSLGACRGDGGFWTFEAR